MKYILIIGDGMADNPVQDYIKRIAIIHNL